MREKVLLNLKWRHVNAFSSPVGLYVEAPEMDSGSQWTLTHMHLSFSFSMAPGLYFTVFLYYDGHSFLHGGLVPIVANPQLWKGVPKVGWSSRVGNLSKGILWNWNEERGVGLELCSPNISLFLHLPWSIRSSKIKPVLISRFATALNFTLHFSCQKLGACKTEDVVVLSSQSHFLNERKRSLSSLHKQVNSLSCCNLHLKFLAQGWPLLACSFKQNANAKIKVECTYA